MTLSAGTLFGLYSNLVGIVIMTAPEEPELGDFLRYKCFDASCTDCFKYYLGEFRAKERRVLQWK
jgi:hypothetical protein